MSIDIFEPCLQPVSIGSTFPPFTSNFGQDFEVKTFLVIFLSLFFSIYGFFSLKDFFQK